MRGQLAVPVSSEVVALVSIGFDIQQRKRAEYARQIGRRRRMQTGSVQLGKAGDPEQPEAPDHFILQQFQHPGDAGFARGGQRPALQAADADEVGT
jgi:hypothetical protein